jgi:hypothetical protein
MEKSRGISPGVILSLIMVLFDMVITLWTVRDEAYIFTALFGMLFVIHSVMLGVEIVLDKIKNK